MKKSLLTVQPLRRYSKPRYPSYAQANPLDNPETLPYPFSQRMMDWALALGLITGISACGEETTLPTAPASNTFTFDKTGLPFTPVSFGTGMPSSLNTKEINAIVHKVFQEEQVSLDSNYVWKDQVSNFPVTGFNEKLRIGYTLLDGKVLDYATIIKQSVNRGDSKPTIWKTLQEAWNSLQKGKYSKDVGFRSGDSYNSFEKITADLEKQATKESLGKVEQWIFWEGFIFEFYEQDINLSGFLPETNAAIDQRNPILFEKALTATDIFRAFYSIKPNPIQLAIKKAREYYLLPESKNKTKIFNAVSEAILQLRSYNKLTSELKKNILTAFEGNQSWNTFLDLKEKFGENVIDLSEIKWLDSLAIQKKAFIVPISFEDKRFQYRDRLAYMQKNHPQLLQDTSYTNKMETDSAAMKNLEVDLKMYIRWAKTQGKY
jgi:hypothetical protein